MEKLREWGFPVALLVGWFIAAAYTVSLMIGPVEKVNPEPQEPPAAEQPIAWVGF